MTNYKRTKKNVPAKDREDNRKFMTVLAIATVILMLVMYFAFVR